MSKVFESYEAACKEAMKREWRARTIHGMPYIIYQGEDIRYMEDEDVHKLLVVPTDYLIDLHNASLKGKEQ